MDGYVPKRGDIVWIDFDPQSGHEQAGRRPAVVVSPAVYNRRARLALLCPITSRVKGYSFEVLLPDGLPVRGVVLADQFKSLDWTARRIDYICPLPAEPLDEVMEKTLTLLEHETAGESRSGPE